MYIYIYYKDIFVLACISELFPMSKQKKEVILEPAQA